MAEIAPETSSTLLGDIAANAANPRWNEFVARYRPMLEAFMTQRFPGLEADDLIQETFIAVARALPDYRYRPEENGRFRSFLTGILHHKALNALRTMRRRAARLEKYAGECTPPGDKTQEEWLEAVFEIALSQLMADPGIPERNKRIFERTAIKGEKPDDVARSLAVSRNVVDQTKKRMLDRLRKTVANLRNAYD